MADEAESPRPTLSPGPMPQHVAIIMDGNGRWAQRRGAPRLQGHAEGARAVRRITTCARENGVKALTLYAFSVQNWGRPDDEVNHLMDLLLDYLESERATLMDNGIRLQGIGQLSRLPRGVQEKLQRMSEESAENRDMVLTLALSYGGREEIIHACRTLAEEAARGIRSPESITEDVVDQYMFTADLPPLDLLIRTSGELRLSNFLLWQAAYSEIVVTDVLWPDFAEEDFFSCIGAYRDRQRRFGLTNDQAAIAD